MNDPGGLPEPDPTMQMPATSAGPPSEVDAPATPWYRKRWIPLAILGVAGVLALAGFLLSQALDDDTPPTVNQLRFDRIDVNGNPLAREVTGEVVGQPGDEDSFLWLAPPNAQAPQPALATTRGSSGRAEFQWAPSDNVEIPEEWTSTITLTEAFAAEESLSATDFECSLQRRGEDDGLVTIAVQFDSPADLTLPRTATYFFPRFSFVAGDVVTCLVPNGVEVPVAVATTTPPETTTTTLPPETTTTTLPPETTTTTTSTSTTVPAETTTTLPPETTTSTTVPAETTTTVAAQGTVMDVIDTRADLSRLRELIDLAGLRDTLSDPAATFTMFTPNNQAFAAAESAPDAPDYADPNIVRPILLTHVHDAGKLSAADVFALPEISVIEPGPHAVDAAAQTIGGIEIIEADVDGGTGFLHVISGVLSPGVA